MDNEKIEKILERLEKVEEKVEENNSILKSERNQKRLAILWKIIYWMIFIASGIVAWSYISPMYKAMIESYEKLMQTNKQVQSQFKDVNKNIQKIKNIF